MPNRDYKIESGVRLKQARRARGWTLAELADHTQTLTPERISNYEQCRRYMSPDVARSLADALKVSTAWLMAVDDDGLTPEEAALIDVYRHCTDEDRRILNRIAETIHPSYKPR